MNPPSQIPAPGRWRDLIIAAEFTLLGIIWGGSFLLMRIASPEIGSASLAFIRVACGALVLLPFLWLGRRQIAPHWWRLGAIGILNSALPFVLFAWATARAPAGISAIANATTVMLTAVVAFVMFGEKIGLRKGIGLLSGFAGVVVLAGGNAAGMDVTTAALAGVAASLCYAVAANLVRVYLAGLPPIAVAAATLLGATVFLAPFALWHWPQAPVSLPAWGAAALLGFVCTGIAYAFLFRLIGKVGPSRAVMVTYLVPLFGVAWAWLVLDEALTVPMAIAGALILGGVAVAQQRRAPSGAPVRATEAPCETGRDAAAAEQGLPPPDDDSPRFSRPKP